MHIRLLLITSSRESTIPDIQKHFDTDNKIVYQNVPLFDDKYFEFTNL